MIQIHDCPHAIYRTAISILRKSTGFAIKLDPAHEADICVLQQEGNTPSGGACPILWFGTIALFFFTGSKIQQKKLIKSLLRGEKKKPLSTANPTAPSHPKTERENFRNRTYSQCSTKSRPLWIRTAIYVLFKWQDSLLVSYTHC